MSKKTRVKGHMRSTSNGKTKVKSHARSLPETDLNFSKKDMDVENPASEFNKKTLNEREVNLLKRRINDGKISMSDLNIIPHYFNGDGWKLSGDQNKKAKDFLVGLWKTPSGSERKNNPFGYREEAILEDFEEVRLRQFYSPRGNYYYPMYEVFGDDTSFQYVYYGGKLHILG